MYVNLFSIKLHLSANKLRLYICIRKIKIENEKILF
jgi:hypothetical protein